MSTALENIKIYIYLKGIKYEGFAAIGEKLPAKSCPDKVRGDFRLLREPTSNFL